MFFQIIRQKVCRKVWWLISILKETNKYYTCDFFVFSLWQTNTKALNLWNIYLGVLQCDMREPDALRVAPVPLYNTFQDVHTFVEILGSAVAAAKQTANSKSLSWSYWQHNCIFVLFSWPNASEVSNIFWGGVGGISSRLGLILLLYFQRLIHFQYWIVICFLLKLMLSPTGSFVWHHYAE